MKKIIATGISLVLLATAFPAFAETTATTSVGVSVSAHAEVDDLQAKLKELHSEQQKLEVEKKAAVQSDAKAHHNAEIAKVQQKKSVIEAINKAFRVKVQAAMDARKAAISKAEADFKAAVAAAKADMQTQINASTTITATTTTQ